MNSRAQILACLLALGATVPSWAIEWQYFGNYNKSTGRPANLVNVANELPAGLLDSVRTKLPEGLDIRKNDPALVTDDFGSNVYLVEDADVRVVFVHEGAGYLNSVGFFTFDPAHAPTSTSEVQDRILFPNFSIPPMKAGEGLNLGRFRAGTALGFTIVANGWKPKLAAVDPAQSDLWIFRSLMGLNPERPGLDQLNAHAVLLSKPEDGLLVLGFEDLNREFGGDHDFNDVLIAIQVTPFTAVERAQVVSLNTVIDTDKDTIPDYLDAFPTDPLRASRRYYPSATAFGQLMFEDNWPRKGDYDLNDLIVAYRITEELNAKEQVVGLKLFYDIVARGASYSNGFALHLPGIGTELIQEKDAKGNPVTTLQIGDKPPAALSPEKGQAEAVFVLANDVNTLTATGVSVGDCKFFNTVTGCPYQEPVRLTAEVRFTKPLARVGTPPYNPFIFATYNRGREIHLVDQVPTSKADPKLFGMNDDGSEPENGRFYRTKNNHVWAIDIPESIEYPIERRDLVGVYPAFELWAESSGAKARDWFFWERSEPGVYHKPQH